MTEQSAVIKRTTEHWRRKAASEMRRLAIAAGDAAMPYFRGEVALEQEAKDDSSPVTAADRAADDVIVSGLESAFPALSVVTEERVDSHSSTPGDVFFLVDPLDGTKEFISGSGEFTVNIALIEDGAPSLGAVYAPALGRLFWTPDVDFAVEEKVEIAAPPAPQSSGAHLWVASANNAAPRIVASRSHRDAHTEAYIARYPQARLESAGSSLKFCLIASGAADLYPRFGPTMAWDTAAAHAVLRASGGRVRRVEPDGSVGAPLRYGPRAFAEATTGDAPAPEGRGVYANPHFIAYAPSVELR